ncbi:MAG: type IX secretion system sortase PorU [Adhaeribacter sp.]
MGRFFTCCVLLLLACCCRPAWSQVLPPGQGFAGSSVLSSGTWYKVGLTTGGLYKLDRGALQKLGLPVDQLDPRMLQLFGNGGAMLPQANSSPRADDLVENAVLVTGEADGRLDGGDYLLFYAPGPHRWHYDAATKRFAHQMNLYTDTAYYFLRLGSGPGLRVRARETHPAAADTITSFHDHQFYEKDLVNVLKSGRNWYGEAFSTLLLSRDFSFSLPGLVTGSTAYLTSAVMGNSESGSAFQVSVNHTLLGRQAFPGRGRYDYHAAGQADTRTFPFPASLVTGNSLQVTLSYQQQGLASATGYLDYLEVNAERQLAFTGNQATFRSTRLLGSGRPLAFLISQVPAGATLWEVSDVLHPRALPLTHHQGKASFTALADSLREYLVFAGSDFPSPELLGPVVPQNLHGLNSDGQLDLVIVTHPLFLPQAQKLARHRRQRDQLQVEVVTTTQVYQEFSSGSQDVTAIRDFMRMLYERQTNSGGKKGLYLLLFGDASYDYKSRIQPNSNFVPVYESRESLDPLSTYSSEDYYGFLNPEEGAWSETQFSTPELLDIGIGRLPVNSAAEAEAVVAKILHYDSPASFGKWRNNLTLLADDGDAGEHLRDAESLAQYLETSQPAYQTKKIYLDLYQQQSLSNGQRVPGATADLNQAVDQGTLLLNYTGHGNESTLAQEELLTQAQVAGWKNYDRLVFFLTATCEFGRYDDPGRSSGAETALLNPQGGAIGLLTTTRPVYASTNRLLNRSFMQAAFSRVNGLAPRLGDLVLQTKNNSQAQVSNRNFTLLGDPTQQLALPSLQAQVSAINAIPYPSSQPDTLRALQQVTLRGKITDEAQALQAGFNGQIAVSIYDKATLVKTLGDESPADRPDIREILLRENKLFAGTATVSEGQWSLSFVVPKDIAYQVGPGLISLYAWNENTDAQGVAGGIPVGGTSPQPQPDTTPPLVRLFLDDESFVPGGLTGREPVLLAQLSDASGINTSGIGIGHEITLTLDGDRSQTRVLNEYYVAEKDNFRNGKIRFPLSGLAPGWHELKLKAWDTHNNAGEASLRFLVTEDGELQLAGVTNFPNPFTGQTTFRFDHNRVNEDLDIQIHIFTVTGKILKRMQARLPASAGSLPSLVWDGRADSGARISPGIYLYQITLRSSRDGRQTQKTGRLIKLN